MEEESWFTLARNGCEDVEKSDRSCYLDYKLQIVDPPRFDRFMGQRMVVRSGFEELRLSEEDALEFPGLATLD